MNKNISIALGGGGIRGLTHIGVLKKLEEYGFNIKAISGTSAGGLVGAAYAAGYSPDEIFDLFEGLNPNSLFSLPKLQSPSILGLKGVSEKLNEILGKRTFKDLNIKFVCTAVDLTTWQQYVYDRGNLLNALLATIAVPGIFPPLPIGNSMLVDGGVMDPVPVSSARMLEPSLPIIAVSLTSEYQHWNKDSTFTITSKDPFQGALLEHLSKLKIGQVISILTKSIDISSHTITELQLQVDKPDVILRPNTFNVGLLDNVDNPQALVKAGEEAVVNNLENISRSCSWWNSFNRKRHAKKFADFEFKEMY